ncbi:hypothetical protein K227x_36420 [Rubripirellula lacrimiformis]|uniref:Uncharacterized protein n=1 Tax=Rubripirellula lacrimiformis TaxID=1930273 RepID=A0A517NDP5_9BACT|nr:hypothetical protein K227x_36420 [Rubripirellula lacrimiformis]
MSPRLSVIRSLAAYAIAAHEIGGCWPKVLATCATNGSEPRPPSVANVAKTFGYSIPGRLRERGSSDWWMLAESLGDLRYQWERMSPRLSVIPFPVAYAIAAHEIGRCWPKVLATCATNGSGPRPPFVANVAETFGYSIPGRLRDRGSRDWWMLAESLGDLRYQWERTAASFRSECRQDFRLFHSRPLTRSRLTRLVDAGRKSWRLALRMGANRGLLP